ncbi:sigma-70 family RNA polymerase sigma factor [Polaribacter sp. MSW13]|uniref:Sigma-70 family RNA polymerase sigma factor n=1 Tax=Polaribacter marinus TaxID=2916838 RepID=A0A9X1VP33_9FLAO|nr:sigma-70 family RNA polymerase sigma factor [Polaribacter marinus]MCI2229685.1 sigma-70 family RNA polymerase sigma factor [Polaribacter marinus]
METNQPHITKLVERCKSSDKTAQLQLYKAYYKAMFNTAFRILKDEFEAEDIMQEAFLTAFTKLHTFKGEVTFGAWLKRIVINKSLTQLKKNNRYEEVKMEVVTNDELKEEVINYKGLNPKDVLTTLNSLKENYRLVLTLNLIEGFDYEEIAQILNYTNENVRTTVSRAKKKLKQVLLANNIKAQAYGR